MDFFDPLDVENSDQVLFAKSLLATSHADYNLSKLSLFPDQRAHQLKQRELHSSRLKLFRLAMSQEPSLPGAYYGPAVPPPQENNPRESFYARFKNWSFYGPVSLLLVLGIVAIIMWQLFCPAPVRAYVTQASVLQFNLTTVSEGYRLEYNMITTILLQNPNTRNGMHYDQIEASVYYQGKRLRTQSLRPFYQGRRSTVPLWTRFSGQSAIPMNSTELLEFDKQRKARVYDVTAVLRNRIRFSVYSFVTVRRNMMINCAFKAPLAGISSPICSVRW